MIGFVGKPAEVLDVTSPNWLPSGKIRPSVAAAATERWKAREMQISQREVTQHPSLQTEYATVSETETVCSDDGSVGFRTCNRKCRSKVFNFTNTTCALCNVCSF